MDSRYSDSCIFIFLHFFSQLLHNINTIEMNDLASVSLAALGIKTFKISTATHIYTHR